MDVDEFLAIFQALDAHRVEYAVFGAVALGLHGLARTTADLDLFVRPDPDNVTRLKDALHVSPRTLWRLKKDTVRPADRIDAAALAERFKLEEER